MNDTGIQKFASRWPLLWVEWTTDYAAFAVAPDGRIVSRNPAAEQILGYTTDEISGHPFAVLYPDEDRRAGVPDAALSDAREHGHHRAEGWRVHRDGRVVWALTTITALRESDGLLAGFGVILRDDSEHKCAHEAVLESERRFRLLVQGVTDYAIFMLSPDGYVTNWNEGARRIKGYEAGEIIGSHFSRFYTPEDATKGVPTRALEQARHDGRFEAEGWRVRRDGSRFWAHVIIDAIRDDGELIGFAKVTRDMTERREADRLLEQTRRELFEAQKMEALGKLTGGVAHNFNNVLQVLRGNLELLQGRRCADAWSRERLDRAIGAVEHGAKFAAQLLAFGRRQMLQPVVVNLATMVRGMDDLLRGALGEAVQVETVVASDLWNTLVDPHQVENVILNLAINARDAMKDGGKLTLELGNAVLDEAYVSGLTDVKAGQYVMLAVTDTGSGMSEDVQQHAFDPFFTTKPVGEGNGLGLSMAYGFVKQSGGHIRIYSEPGHGTTIRIYLPRSMAHAVEPVARPDSGLTRGNETILVVEDNPKVQSTVVDMLAGLGYTVLKADDAQRALGVLASGVNIDLLFTDVVMPGPLRSADMAKQAVGMHPGLKVLFTSGYTQNAIVHGGRLDPGVELLSKPYSRHELARRLRQLLDKPRYSPDADEVAQERAVAGPVPVTERTRILVVEDDIDSLDAICEILVMTEYAPTKAAAPDVALDALRSGRFDVLLTDIELPGMSGLDLAGKAIALQPHIRVILASGHPVPDDAVAGVASITLQKPYSIEQLVAAIRTACDGRYS
ncbi:PAS domain S-box protein [Paraburkholderia tropica]|uniref:PAS domain S-box protein n=1 Tax=Paraburkholderia tropica TaxID=92647 RepID=UPI002AB2559B|nr:PAS domain S-box protein [Paraburkholderia tropica]